MAINESQRSGVFFLYVIVSLIIISVLTGCSSAPKDVRVIAIVDGYPVTEHDLIRSINVFHRQEGLSMTGELNLSQYAQKLIDERLLIEDARRMGMEESPSVKKAVDAFILRESIMMLYNEEILEKISVSDEDALDRYKQREEQFLLGIIEFDSMEDAAKVSELIKKGDDFKELAAQYSTHVSKKDGGNITIKRKFMKPKFAAVVLDLKVDDVSEPFGIDNKFYIVKLLERKEAPVEEFEKNKEDFKKAMLKEKEKERSDEYLEFLRKKIPPKIDQSLLSEIKNIDLDMNPDELKALTKDKRNIVEVGEYSMTYGELLSAVIQRKHRMRELGNPFDKETVIDDVIKKWSDNKLVDIEAMSREYHKKTVLKERVESYRNSLMKDEYIREVIAPQIKVSEEILRKYYLENQDRYMKPSKVKIQQITIKSMDEAMEVEKSLKEGADFSWLAKWKSIDEAKERGGEKGWFNLTDLPESMRNAINNLQKGEISQIIEVEEGYRIIKVQDRTKEEVENFDVVKDRVFRDYRGEEFKSIYDQYVAELKKNAEIIIYDDVIREIEQEIGVPTTKE